MTISEILEQAKALSPQERKELAKRLIDLLDEPAVPAGLPLAAPAEHWGENLLRLLEAIGTIEMLHPEIEDPVEWVKRIRQEQQQKRLGDWGGDE